jgi:hypothetical protein
LGRAVEEARVARRKAKKLLVNCMLYSWSGLDLKTKVRLFCDEVV